MKTFFLSDTGQVSRHKLRAQSIVGHGIVHKDQVVKVYTSKKEVTYQYDEIKVGTHDAKDLVHLTSDETILKIEILNSDRV